MSRLIDTEGKLLYEIFDNELVKRMDSKAFCWEITHETNWLGFYTPDAIFKRKSLLKLIIKDFPNSIINCEQDPIEDELTGDWFDLNKTRLSMGPWIIPNNIEFNEFYDWFLTNHVWEIYYSETYVETPNLWFAQHDYHIDDYFLSMMNENIPFSLQLDHDDKIWRIIINHFWKEKK